MYIVYCLLKIILLHRIHVFIRLIVKLHRSINSKVVVVRENVRKPHYALNLKRRLKINLRTCETRVTLNFGCMFIICFLRGDGASAK